MPLTTANFPPEQNLWDGKHERCYLQVYWHPFQSVESIASFQEGRRPVSPNTPLPQQFPHS